MRTKIETFCQHSNHHNTCWKTISTVENHANTSAASIPLAISSAMKSGKIKKNDILALCAIGGGLTWGSCILKIWII